MLERDAGTAGEFSVRASDYHVLRFRYDARTVVDREQANIDVPALRPGEQVEVIAAQMGDDPLRYARAIHVTVALPAPAARRRAPPSRIRPFDAAENRLPPQGDLSLSGVIVRLDAGRLVLRTRTAGEQTILLRQDTRYLDNGELTAQASLQPTMHVNVRGSKNLYGDVEGYQVAWGDILEVHK